MASIGNWVSVYKSPRWYNTKKFKCPRCDKWDLEWIAEREVSGEGLMFYLTFCLGGNREIKWKVWAHCDNCGFMTDEEEVSPNFMKRNKDPKQKRLEEFCEKNG